MCSRFFADRLREHFGNIRLCIVGSIIAVFGLALVLFTQGMPPALFGFALMGMGLSPVASVLFSLARNYPNVNNAKACATVSIFAYSGLLFFPPLLGFVAYGYGLDKTVFVVFAMCILLYFRIIALGRKK